MSLNRFFLGILVLGLFFGLTACTSVSGEKVQAAAAPETAPSAVTNAGEKGVVILSKIEIQTGSPSEVVRNFYKLVREKRFVDAMMLTNMKAAVDGLTLEDLKELGSDFEAMAPLVPADLTITGEQISGDKASVFIKLPGQDGGPQASDEMKLRKEGNNWILLADGDAEEARAKKLGRNYFFVVRIEMHHLDVENMLKQIMQAQAIFSSNGKGLYGDRDVLIREGLLPVDITGSYTTGYNFSIVLSQDKKSYYVNAVPAVYGKSGKLSFMMEVSGNSEPKTKSSDNGGMPLKR